PPAPRGAAAHEAPASAVEGEGVTSAGQRGAGGAVDPEARGYLDAAVQPARRRAARSQREDETARSPAGREGGTMHAGHGNARRLPEQFLRARLLLEPTLMDVEVGALVQAVDGFRRHET